MVYLLRRKKLGRTSCRGIQRFSQTGIQVIRNDQDLPEADTVFRWGCTSNVEAENIINQAEAIHLVSDKKEFRVRLSKAQLAQPTWLVREQIEVPCVIRPRLHAQGRKLFYCTTQAEVDAAVRLYPDFYAASYIPKVAEYRVFIVQGRAVWVASKTPGNPADIAWNVARGGRFDNMRWENWPLKVVRLSIDAFKLSGLDFGGVDAMVDAAGKVYILEINAAPSQTSPYRQSCTAKAFDWIIKNGKAEIPLVPEKGDWKKFIHPAIQQG